MMGKCNFSFYFMGSNYYIDCKDYTFYIGTIKLNAVLQVNYKLLSLY